MALAKNKKFAGFTIVEIIIVIAVFVLIAMIGVGGWQAAQVKKNDAVRVADAKEVQAALDAYYNAAGVFPGVCEQGYKASAKNMTFDCLTPGKPLIAKKDNKTFLALAPLDPPNSSQSCEDKESCYIPCPPEKYHPKILDNPCLLDGATCGADDDQWQTGYQWLYCLDGNTNVKGQTSGVNTTTYDGLRGTSCDNAESDSVLCATKFQGNWSYQTTTDSCGETRHINCGLSGGGGPGCACSSGVCCNSNCGYKAGEACGHTAGDFTIKGYCSGQRYEASLCVDGRSDCQNTSPSAINASSSFVYNDDNGDTQLADKNLSCSSTPACSNNDAIINYFGCDGHGACDMADIIDSTTVATCTEGCRDGACVTDQCSGGACCDTSTSPYKFMADKATPKGQAPDGDWLCVKCDGTTSTPVAIGSSDSRCTTDDAHPCRDAKCSGSLNGSGNGYCAYLNSDSVCSTTPMAILTKDSSISIDYANYCADYYNTYSCDGSHYDCQTTGNSTTHWGFVTSTGDVFYAKTDGSVGERPASCDATCSTGTNPTTYYLPNPPEECYGNTPKNQPVGCSKSGDAEGKGVCDRPAAYNGTCVTTACSGSTPFCSGGQCVDCLVHYAYYQDLDGDLYGNINGLTTTTCSNIAPQGYTATSTAIDCDDNADWIFPGKACCGTNGQPAAVDTTPTVNGTNAPFVCVKCDGSTSTPMTVAGGTVSSDCNSSASTPCKANTCSGTGIGYSNYSSGNSYCAYQPSTYICQTGAWSMSADKCTIRQANDYCSGNAYDCNSSNVSTTTLYASSTKMWTAANPNSQIYTDCTHNCGANGTVSPTTPPSCADQNTPSTTPSTCDGNGSCVAQSAWNNGTCSPACANNGVCQDGVCTAQCTSGACCVNNRFITGAPVGTGWTCVTCNGATNTPVAIAQDADLYNQCTSTPANCQQDACSGNLDTNGNSYCTYKPSTYVCASSTWSIDNSKCTISQTVTYCQTPGNSYACNGATQAVDLHASSTKLWSAADPTSQISADCTHNCSISQSAPYAYTALPNPATACFDSAHPLTQPAACDGSGGCHQQTAYNNTCSQCQANATCSAGQCVCPTYYRDADNDGYGNVANASTTCADPGTMTGWVLNHTDCADNLNWDYPGAACCTSGGVLTPDSAPSLVSATATPFTCVVCNGNADGVPVAQINEDLFGQCHKGEQGVCEVGTCSGAVVGYSTIGYNSYTAGNSDCSSSPATVVCAGPTISGNDGDCIVTSTAKYCSGTHGDYGCNGTAIVSKVYNTTTDDVWNATQNKFVAATCALNCATVNSGCTMDNKNTFVYYGCSKKTVTIDPACTNLNTSPVCVKQDCSATNQICQEADTQTNGYYPGSCASFNCGANITYPHSICLANSTTTCSYVTVNSANQCWTGPLNLGTIITTGSGDQNNNPIQRYCYGNDQSSCNSSSPFGALYQWAQTMATSSYYNTHTLFSGGAPDKYQGICPPGFHIPVDNGAANTANEWWTLEDSYVTSTTCVASRQLSSDCVPAGAFGNMGYYNNTTWNGAYGGFSDTGSFADIGAKGHFWSTMEFSTGKAEERVITSSTPPTTAVFRGYRAKNNGLTVRCVR